MFSSREALDKIGSEFAGCRLLWALDEDVIIRPYYDRACGPGSISNRLGKRIGGSGDMITDWLRRSSGSQNRRHVCAVTMVLCRRCGSWRNGAH